jgi:hypothetical protein
MATVVQAEYKNATFEVARRSVTETAEDLASSLAALRDCAAAITRGIFDADPMQKMFVGFVRDYRYTAGREGEAPSHRFYIECTRGMWLYARVPSSQFEALMQDLAMEITPSNVNGQMIVVRADEGTNALVPIRFVEDLKCADRFGNLLFVGAPVVAADGGPGSVEGLDFDDEVRVTLDLSGALNVYPQSEIVRRF